MEVRKELSEFLKKTGISQNKAGEGAGYTGSVVSQYLAGTYKGNVEEVEGALKRWMVREQKRRSRRTIPTVQTDTLVRITNAITMAHEERDLAVIVGPAGTGKTKAVLQYAEDNPHGTVVIRVTKAMKAHRLLQSVAEALSVDKRCSLGELADRISSSLQDRDMCVVLDEADYLSDAALDLVRQVVYDGGETGLVLVGLPRLIHQLRNAKNDHQQLTSRVGILLQVDGLKESDAKAVIATVWPEAGKDTVRAFFKAAGTSIRQLCKLIDRAWRTAVANNIEIPDEEIIQLAGSFIMKQ